MTISIKKLVLLFFISLLVSCSGTGKKGAVLFQETKTPSTRIFVKRQTGHPRSLALIKVTLNGTEIGKLREKGRLSGLTEVGSGVLSASFTGLTSIGTSNVSRPFTIKNGEKLFFIITQETGMFLKKLRIYPVSQNDFFAD